MWSQWSQCCQKQPPFHCLGFQTLTMFAQCGTVVPPVFKRGMYSSLPVSLPSPPSLPLLLLIPPYQANCASFTLSHLPLTPHSSLPCVQSIMSQVLAGVAYLHANSVLHRDLKVRVYEPRWPYGTYMLWEES